MKLLFALLAANLISAQAATQPNTRLFVAARHQATPSAREFTLFNGRWHNGTGLVETDKQLARSGKRCIHLLGSVEFEVLTRSLTCAGR